MTSHFHICPVPVCSSIRVRWGDCSSAGVRDGRSNRSREVINCIFTLLMSVFIALGIQSDPVFGLKESTGKDCQGLFIRSMSCQGKLLIQQKGEWILGWMCCRARWMSSYTSQVGTCPVDCIIRHGPSAVLHLGVSQLLHLTHDK